MTIQERTTMVYELSIGHRTTPTYALKLMPHLSPVFEQTPPMDHRLTATSAPLVIIFGQDALVGVLERWRDVAGVAIALHSCPLTRAGEQVVANAAVSRSATARLWLSAIRIQGPVPVQVRVQEQVQGWTWVRVRRKVKVQCEPQDMTQDERYLRRKPTLQHVHNYSRIALRISIHGSHQHNK